MAESSPTSARIEDASVARAQMWPRRPALYLSLPVIAILHLILGIAIWSAPSVDATIPLSKIRTEQGAAYLAAIPPSTRFPYTLPSDTSAASTASRLLLLEDGKPLGPAHAFHADIRQSGGGRYSHWNDDIYFSASDGSDPRTNGRTYTYRSSTRLHPSILLPSVVILALMDTCVLIAFRRRLNAFLRARGTVLMRVTALGCVIVSGLAAFGAFGQLTLAGPGTAKGAAFIWALMAHACLGVAVSIGMWAAAAGLVLLVLRKQNASLPLILLPAFPLSLVMFAVASAIALLLPRGGVIIAVLWLACLLPLIRWRPSRVDLARLVTVLLGIIPFAMLFGFWLGLLWHGPTETLNGYPSGDLVFYATSMLSLAVQPYPFVDLAYANSAPLGYFNMLYSGFGAILTEFRGFDPFLYLLAGGGAAFILYSGLTLHLYLIDRAAPPDHYGIAVLLLAFLTALPYPYWVAESTPIIYLPALVVVVWWTAQRGLSRPAWAVAALIVGLGGSVLTKVVTAAVLVPAAAAGAHRRLRSLPFSARVLVWASVLAFALYAIAMLVSFLPTFLGRADIGPNGYRYPTWWFIARDIATLALIVISFLAFDFGIALALSIGFASALAFAFLFTGNFSCAALLLGVMSLTYSERAARYRWPITAALAFTLPSVFLALKDGLTSGAIWVCCVCGMVIVALAVANSAFSAQILRAVALCAFATAAVAALGLFGAATGNIIASSGWNAGQPAVTPEVRDIWLAARRLTRPDALIFTDQVSEQPTLLGGWNLYAVTGQRQIYLSNFMNSDLRTDLAKLRSALAINEAVLSGQRRPTDVQTRDRYRHFFAVISASRQAPADWDVVYRNSKYNLFQIRP
jgi:hypothetical protein